MYRSCDITTYSIGGYLICGGNEKIIISQMSSAKNEIMIHTADSGELYAEINSTDPNEVSPFLNKFMIKSMKLSRFKQIIGVETLRPSASKKTRKNSSKTFNNISSPNSQEGDDDYETKTQKKEKVDEEQEEFYDDDDVDDIKPTDQRRAEQNEQHQQRKFNLAEIRRTLHSDKNNNDNILVRIIVPLYHIFY